MVISSIEYANQSKVVRTCPEGKSPVVIAAMASIAPAE